MKTKKTLIGALLLAAVAVGAACYFLFGGAAKVAELSFETARCERATISAGITATGTIEPVTKVEVGTQVSGIISKIWVDYNSVVKRGQVIAELDKTNLMSELNSARSNLAGAKSDLDYQTSNHKRLHALHEKGLVSDNEYDAALLALRQAESTYRMRSEALAKAQTNLGYATITSPIDGVILSKAVEEGQTVAASFSTPTLFTIARDLTDMRVIADVDEADIGGVHEGQRVSFNVDAYPGDTFEGRVTQVRQEATTESNVVTYEVVISAPNADLRLKPGLTANVTIFTLERDSVLSVPSKALRFTPSAELLNGGMKIADCNAKQKVWVREGNVLRALPVTTGSVGTLRTEIKSGVKAGTEVVTDISAVLSEETGSGTESSENSPFAPGPRRNNKDTKK